MWKLLSLLRLLYTFAGLHILSKIYHVLAQLAKLLNRNDEPAVIMTSIATVSGKSVLRDITRLLKHLVLLIALVILMLRHWWSRYELSLDGRIFWTYASHLLNGCLLWLDLLLGWRLRSTIALRIFIVLQNRGRLNGRVLYSSGWLLHRLNNLLSTHKGGFLENKQTTLRTASSSAIDNLNSVWLRSYWLGALSRGFIYMLSFISFIFLNIIRIYKNGRRC